MDCTSQPVGSMTCHLLLHFHSGSNHVQSDLNRSLQIDPEAGQLYICSEYCLSKTATSTSLYVCGAAAMSTNQNTKGNHYAQGPNEYPTSLTPRVPDSRRSTTQTLFTGIFSFHLIWNPKSASNVKKSTSNSLT